jgi:prolyl-tRNA synthetase
LQCCTSHFLGQNFSKAYDVSFLNAQGEQDMPWGTSWGFTTRMVGALVMAHGDDKGLRLPPAVAPVQVVVVPIYKTDDERASVLDAAMGMRDELTRGGLRVRVDDRDQYRPGYKFSEWELKGVPVRIELGPRDLAARQVVIADRITGDKSPTSMDEAVAGMAARLDAVQAALFSDARSFVDANTHAAGSFDELTEGIDAHGGFWVGAWCGERACEEKVTAETKATIRVLPIEREDPGGPCLVCGKAGTERATWGRAY